MGRRPRPAFLSRSPLPSRPHRVEIARALYAHFVNLMTFVKDSRLPARERRRIHREAGQVLLLYERLRVPHRVVDPPKIPRPRRQKPRKSGD